MIVIQTSPILIFLMQKQNGKSEKVLVCCLWPQHMHCVSSRFDISILYIIFAIEKPEPFHTWSGVVLDCVHAVPMADAV